LSPTQNGLLKTGKEEKAEKDPENDQRREKDPNPATIFPHRRSPDREYRGRSGKVLRRARKKLPEDEKKNRCQKFEYLPGINPKSPEKLLSGHKLRKTESRKKDSDRSP